MGVTSLAWMLPPLAMCLVLGGIHGYLGIHVLSRKVIFVDLALAQIAALGAVCATLLGYHVEHSPGTVYVVSLSFTFVGAGLFAWTRLRRQAVPQEALIGITYATASAVALMLLAKAPGESEHIKSMLAGNILLVTWSAVAKTAAIYAVVGGFHYVFRKPFLEISANPSAAMASGRNVRLWDFLFYATFGVVITSSVAVAGVLLVFAFLVVPAVIAFFFSAQLRTRLTIAWSIAGAASVVGIVLSYSADMPTAPSVVVSLAALLLIAAGTRAVTTSVRPARALGTLAILILVVGAIVVGLGTRTNEPREVPDDPLVREVETAQARPATTAANATALGRELLRAESDDDFETLLQQLATLGPGGKLAAPFMLEAAHHKDDPFLQLEIVRALMVVHPETGLVVAEELVNAAPPVLVETELDAVLAPHLGRKFGLGEGETREARENARQVFRQYLRSLAL